MLYEVITRSADDVGRNNGEEGSDANGQGPVRLDEHREHGHARGHHGDRQQLGAQRDHPVGVPVADRAAEPRVVV